MTRYYILGFLLALYIGCGEHYTIAQIRNDQPLLWDYHRLNVDTLEGNDGLRETVRSVGPLQSFSQPITITDKNKSFSGNKHDYCSMAIYWWPDEKASDGKYLRRDGYTNPEYKQYDLPKLSELENRCRTLSLLCYISHDKRYYKSFVKQLRAWFVNKKTRMNPNFEYAQVIPGYDNNRGRSTGLIEAYSFVYVLESIRLVECVKPLDKKTRNGVKKWFDDFATWMMESDLGKAQSKVKDNNGIAYDVTLLAMLAYTDRNEEIEKLLNDFTNKRILSSIAPDGMQPRELQRTKAYSYSIMNLNQILDFCIMSKSLGYPIYDKNKKRVDAAYNYLASFVGHKEKFPYPQITDWASCENDLKKAKTKLDRLNK